MALLSIDANATHLNWLTLNGPPQVCPLTFTRK
jgi:hypothetical protein